MNVPIDKVLHALAGGCIAAVAYPFGLLVAVLALVVIGVSKEVVYDKLMAQGTPSLLDAFVTIWSGVCMLGWLEIMRFYL